MKPLKELLPMIDKQIIRMLEVRGLDKEEFDKKFGEDLEYIRDHILKSKCGLIRIQKEGNRPHYGITTAFGENIGCYISNPDEWYITSVIQNINWDKKEFQTLNSIYKFEFEELPWEELYADLQLYIKERESEDESKD